MNILIKITMRVREIYRMKERERESERWRERLTYNNNYKKPGYQIIYYSNHYVYTYLISTNKPENITCE